MSLENAAVEFYDCFSCFVFRNRCGVSAYCHSRPAATLATHVSFRIHQSIRCASVCETNKCHEKSVRQSEKQWQFIRSHSVFLSWETITTQWRRGILIFVQLKVWRWQSAVKATGFFDWTSDIRRHCWSTSVFLFISRAKCLRCTQNVNCAPEQTSQKKIHTNIM